MKRNGVSATLLLGSLSLYGCEEAPRPPAEAGEASSTKPASKVSARPLDARPSIESAVSVPADFEDEAAREIDEDNYKEALRVIEAELSE